MTAAEVRLWGRVIGAVSLEDDRDYAAFQYDSDFAQSGIEISLKRTSPKLLGSQSGRWNALSRVQRPRS